MPLTRLGSILALVLLGLTPWPARAQTPTGKGNLLPPITGAQEWALIVRPPAKATLTRQARAVLVSVTAAGDQPWQAQVAHYGTDLQDGQAYTLRFRARAAAPRPMLVFGGIMQHDYHDVGLSRTVSLTGAWKEFVIPFTARGVVAGQVGAPEFQFGARTGRVWLADVTLAPSGGAVRTAGTAPTPATASSDAIAPGLWPHAGETLLEGTIREMRPAQRQFVLLVTRRLVPEGATTNVEPPRQQLISVGAGAALQRLPEKAPSGRNPLATLQPGDRIAVLGSPAASKPVAARLVVIAAKGTTPASAPDAP